MAKKIKARPPGQVRIIGGQWRGRKLPVLNSEGLRPTTDRIRETLFNWLAPELAGARCLDCFAGSGALGLEALSRYAAKVVLVERDRQVARRLEENSALLNAVNAEVVNADTLSWLTGPGTPFDIVFIDPPFRQAMAEQVIQRLEQYGWLAENAAIYIETEAERQAIAVPAGWRLYRQKTAGQVSYCLYHRNRQTFEG